MASRRLDTKRHLGNSTQKHTICRAGEVSDTAYRSQVKVFYTRQGLAGAGEERGAMSSTADGSVTP